MNVFRQEIRANLKSTLLWTAVLTGISAMVLSFYPIFQKDLDNFVAVLNNFPDVMKSIMGMNAHIFFSPLEYYCFVLNFTLLFAGIQAMNLGVGIVSKETRDKTADFLMTKPISRTRILHAKILASTALLAATAAVYSVLIYPVFHAIADEFPDTSRYLLLCLAFFMESGAKAFNMINQNEMSINPSPTTTSPMTAPLLKAIRSAPFNDFRAALAVRDEA